jgi:hypothetical protein
VLKWKLFAPTRPSLRNKSRPGFKEIRQQAHAQVESIISSQQQQELKACNAERNAGRTTVAGGPKPARPPLGPCGESPTAPHAMDKNDPGADSEQR